MSYVKFLRQYVGNAPILTAGTGLLVFNDKKEVLMQLRTDYNAWGFPGGAMELGESFEETAKRELKEETNLESNDLKLLCISDDMTETAHYVTVGFIAEEFHGELKTMEPETIIKWEWFDIDNIPENMYKPSLKCIEKYKTGIIYK